MKFFSQFSQSSENSAGHVFHLFKLKFSVVTSLVILSKRKILKNKKNCRVSARVVRKPYRFVSRFHQIVLPEPFGRSGHPCSHQVVIKDSDMPLGSHLPLVSSVLVFVPLLIFGNAIRN